MQLPYKNVEGRHVGIVSLIWREKVKEFIGCCISGSANIASNARGSWCCQKVISNKPHHWRNLQLVIVRSKQLGNEDR